MDYARYIVWAAAIFFASTWLFALFVDPRKRIKSTVVSVGLWWALLAFPVLGAFSVLHLAWLMPLALFIPMAIQMGHLQRKMAHPSLGYVAIGSILPVLGPALALTIF